MPATSPAGDESSAEFDALVDKYHGLFVAALQVSALLLRCGACRATPKKRCSEGSAASLLGRLCGHAYRGAWLLRRPLFHCQGAGCRQRRLLCVEECCPKQRRCSLVGPHRLSTLQALFEAHREKYAKGEASLQLVE